MKGGGWTGVGAGTLATVAEQQVNKASSRISQEQQERLMGIDRDKKPEEAS